MDSPDVKYRPREEVEIVPPEYFFPNILPEEPSSETSKVRSTEDLDTPYSDLLVLESSKNPELLKFFGPWQNQVVVDLGSGSWPWGYRLAGMARAKGYIGIEPYNINGLESSIKHSALDLTEKGFPKIPAAVVKQDALNFLRRLPPESVSVLASGLDNIILQAASENKKLKEELERVLHPEGAFIKFSSTGDLSLNQNAFSSERLPTIKGITQIDSNQLIKFQRK